ncbi:MAG: tRNA-dihydrouridine synthase [Planctomycetales bacterium]
MSSPTIETPAENPLTTVDTTGFVMPASLREEESGIRVGNRDLETRYFLAPLAGYTQLAFRLVIRENGGLGLATTDLVQAVHLVHGHRKSVQLIQTCPEDHPLAVQIYGGKTEELVKAAQFLEQKGYASVDINMGCPMAKVVGTGGGARLMCNVTNATDLVERVVTSVKIPVTVKMRLGWDDNNITAPELARAFEEIGVAAITIHGRTRWQGFSGKVNLEGIQRVVEAVKSIPVIGNGDVRTVADAIRMRELTGCRAVAIGRGAMLDPWIFQRLQRAHAGKSLDWEPTPQEQIQFLRRHFYLMTEHRTEEWSCIDFRKFAAWYGARLGVPEELEDRLRRFTSCKEFDEITDEIRERHGTRRDPRPTSDIKVPNGPTAHW